MKKELQIFFKLLAWDFKFAVKYHIVTVAAIITLLYSSVFFLFRSFDLTLALKLMLFSDPTVLGFMFVGALILFEKNSNVLQAIAVSPLKNWHYLGSKAIVLTTIALLCSFGMTLAAVQLNFKPLLLIATIGMSSLIFVFIGVIGVARVKTFNQYILIIPLYLIPTVLPLLNYFNITNLTVLYLVPTQATLNLMDASFNTSFTGKNIIDLIYLFIWLITSFTLAKRMYRTQILSQ